MREWTQLSLEKSKPVIAFLRELPIRERDENGAVPGFWLEKGIHNGRYDLDESGRLRWLRFLMMPARKQWVD